MKVLAVFPGNNCIVFSQHQKYHKYVNMLETMRLLFLFLKPILESH